VTLPSQKVKAASKVVKLSTHFIGRKKL